MAGCGGGKSTPKTAKSTSAAPVPSLSATSPPPHFTSQQLLRRLISAKDIGPGFEQSIIGTRAFLDSKALMCSLSGVKLPGKPEIGVRQYASNAKIRYGKNYNQFVALYPDADQANRAFAAIKAVALKCPPKQHVPAQPDPTSKSTLFQHDDTWTLSPQDTIEGWAHLRGWEREVYSPKATKHNIIFDAYDYSLRGNLILATLYNERADPKDTGDAIKQRASEVLTKQLKALG